MYKNYKMTIKLLQIFENANFFKKIKKVLQIFLSKCFENLEKFLSFLQHLINELFYKLPNISKIVIVDKFSLSFNKIYDDFYV